MLVIILIGVDTYFISLGPAVIAEQNCPRRYNGFAQRSAFSLCVAERVILKVGKDNNILTKSGFLNIGNARLSFLNDICLFKRVKEMIDTMYINTRFLRAIYILNKFCINGFSVSFAKDSKLNPVCLCLFEIYTPVMIGDVESFVRQY